MATSTITNTVTDPTGAVLAGVPVVISLFPKGAFRISDSTEVAPVYTTVTNASGVWTAALERSANISPSNSYYVVEEQIPANRGGTRRWAFQVGAVNTTLLASLVTPLASGGVGSYLTQAAADARYQALAAFASPTDSRPGDVLTAGVATSGARSDHLHSRETVSGTAAQRAALLAAGTANGLQFNETDTFKWFKRLASTWVQYLVTHVGAAASKPATNHQGQPYYITDAAGITGTGIATPDTTSQPARGDNIWYQNSAGRWQMGEWGKPWGIMGVVDSTASLTGVTTITDITGMTLTFVAAANRRIKITAMVLLASSVAADIIRCSLTDSSNVVVQIGQVAATAAAQAETVQFSRVLSPAAGSVTYKLRLERLSGTGTVSNTHGATFPSQLLIEDIGPNGAPA